MASIPTATPRKESLVVKSGKQLKKSKGNSAFAGGIGAHFISTGVTAAPVETAASSAQVAQVSTPRESSSKFERSRRLDF